MGIAEVMAAADGGWSDIVTNTNFPGVVVLGLAGLPAMFFLFRWMIRFQKEFTEFYIAENQKLRERVDELEEEVRTKDTTILEFRAEIWELKAKHQEQERQITYLNGIIDRRKLGDRRDDGIGDSTSRRTESDH